MQLAEVPKDTQAEKRSYSCEACDKVFTTRQARHTHKHHYCKRGTPVPTAKQLGAELDKLRAQVAALLQQRHSGEGACGSVGTINNNTVNNTTNNTTTNNTTNNITINKLCQEDLSFLAHEIVRDLVKQSDLYASLQEVVKLVHFNPEHPQNQNVYLPDDKAEHGFCRSDEAWEKIPTKKIAKLVMTGAASIMCHHNDAQFSSEYSKQETKRFDVFFDRVDRDDRPIRDTINTMATCSRSIAAPKI